MTHSKISSTIHCHQFGFLRLRIAALSIIVLGIWPLANAQWVDESYSLKAGWNAIWISVDASHETIDNLVTNENIEQIWLWNTAASTSQFVGSPQESVKTDVRWQKWIRITRGEAPGAPVQATSTLNRFMANAAYLIKVKDEVGQFELALRGRPVPPRYTFSGSDANFFGFPMMKPGSLAQQSFDRFLSISPDLTAGTNIFRYDGTPNLKSELVNRPRLTQVRRGEAYWIQSDQYSGYYGPLRITVGLNGLDYGDTGSVATIRIKNVIKSALTATLTLKASVDPPDGQVPNAGMVPLSLRGGIDPETLQFTSTALVEGEGLEIPLSAAGEAGDEVELYLALGRGAMIEGSTPGDVFQSILEVTDSMGISRIDLPVRAERTSPGGLWAGAAVIGESSQVSTMVEPVSQDGQWIPIPGDTANSPEGRVDPIAVWNGNEMLVVGGSDLSGPVEGGAIFNPVTNLWNPIESGGMPALAQGSQGIWTGSELMVWGGFSPAGGVDAGEYSQLSLAMIDGHPAVAYFDRQDEEILFARSLDPQGRSWADPVVVDVLDDPGSRKPYLELAEIDGHPAIAYFHHALESSVRYARASDANGSHWNDPITVASHVGNGNAVSLVALANAENVPAIAYVAIEANDGVLKFTAADDSAGSSWDGPSLTLVSPNTAIRFMSSMVLVDRNPAIVFQSHTPDRLQFVRASDSDGSAWSDDPVDVLSEGSDQNGQRYGALAVIDGHPAIGFWTGGEQKSLSYVRSGDSQGVNWGTPVLVEEDLPFAFNLTLSESGGAPYISYSGDLGTDSGFIRTVIANDPEGSVWQDPHALASLGQIRQDDHLHATTDVNGRAGIVYYNFLQGRLEFITDRAATASGIGWLYDSETWAPVSGSSSPSARVGHSVIWTGSEAIVWGGKNVNGILLNDGGQYEPGADSWRPTAASGAPDPRSDHTTVWSGTEMIVWGGLTGDETPLKSGGVYDPTGPTWSSISETGSPVARSGHTATWTNSAMVVWGGADESGALLRDGGRYDPETNTWQAINLQGAPSARTGHKAFWKGDYLVIWGGISGAGEFLKDGARYDPEFDEWTPLPQTDAPEGGRGAASVWTGSEWIFWGGRQSSGTISNSGAALEFAAANAPETVTQLPDGSQLSIIVRNGSRITRTTKMVEAPSTFPIRLILHQEAAEGNDSLRLLQKVFLGEDNNDTTILATSQALLDPENLSTAKRLSSSSFPLGYAAVGSAPLGLSGKSTFDVDLSPSAATNPFLHPYHPDHGSENSLLVRRDITLEWVNDPTELGITDLGWGSTTAGGRYRETITGLRSRQPIVLEGTFILRRVSNIATIKQ